MNAASFWESFLWTKWAKPVSRRRLYQRIQRGAPIRIVEFGLGDGQRAERMLRLAARYSDQRIQYCGIDLFEAREHDPLPLKKVHNKLAATGAKVRLVPGDLFAALGRTANLLTQTDVGDRRRPVSGGPRIGPSIPATDVARGLLDRSF